MSSPQETDQILQEVGQTIKSYPFSYKGASILSGQEEGAYGWVTVNYLLENFIKVPLIHQNHILSQTMIQLETFVQCTAAAHE